MQEKFCYNNMYGKGNNENNNNLNNLLGIFLDAYSVYLGEQNLQLNNDQVKALDAHLQKQDNEYLIKMLERLEFSIEQNKILIEQNKQVIELLNKR